MKPRKPKCDEVLKRTARVWIERVGYGAGRRVRLWSPHNGWSIPLEWATRESAQAGHLALAKARYWEAATHLEAARYL